MIRKVKIARLRLLLPLHYGVDSETPGCGSWAVEMQGLASTPLKGVKWTSEWSALVRQKASGNKLGVKIRPQNLGSRN